MSSEERIRVQKQFLTITSEIQLLLEEIVSRTSAGEELDVALDHALGSFTPLFELYGINEDTLENTEIPGEPLLGADKRRDKNKNEEKENTLIVEETSKKSTTKQTDKTKETSVLRAQAQELTSLVQRHPQRKSRKRSKTVQQGVEEEGDSNEESVYESLTHHETLQKGRKGSNHPSEIY